MLASIEIQDFRCIERATLDLDTRGTGIVGRNASGKTSLLEAIFFLAHGRSFRIATRSRLVRRGCDSFRVIARLADGDRTNVASAEHDRGSTHIRFAGSQAGFAEIAEIFPVQVIDPGVHRLIDEGSTRRRRLLDWGVFHVKQDFLREWRRYQRALAQRNAALRDNLEDRLVDAWDEELLNAAAHLDTARSQYVTTLASHFVVIAEELLGEKVALEYRRGWSDEMTLAASLEQARRRDRRHATTTVGPHRADLTIKMDGILARDRVSRGQQKLLAAALILAQIWSTHKQGSSTACLLLDDPAAELDVDKLGKLLRAIQKTPAQLVVSSLTEAGLAGIDIGRKFHVEQGHFAPML